MNQRTNLLVNIISISERGKQVGLSVLPKSPLRIYRRISIDPERVNHYFIRLYDATTGDMYHPAWFNFK